MEMTSMNIVMMLNMIEEIERAVKSHRDWARRLEMAVSMSTFDMSIDEVADVHACEFGKWL